MQTIEEWKRLFNVGVASIDAVYKTSNPKTELCIVRHTDTTYNFMTFVNDERSILITGRLKDVWNYIHNSGFKDAMFKLKVIDPFTLEWVYTTDEQEYQRYKDM